MEHFNFYAVTVPGPNVNPAPCARDILAIAFVRSFNEVASDITSLEMTSIPNNKTLCLVLTITLYTYVS